MMNVILLTYIPIVFGADEMGTHKKRKSSIKKPGDVVKLAGVQKRYAQTLKKTQIKREKHLSDYTASTYFFAL